MRDGRPKSTGLCVTPYRTMRNPPAKPLKFRDCQTGLIYRTMRSCDKNMTERKTVRSGRNAFQEKGCSKGAQPTELCVAKSLSALDSAAETRQVTPFRQVE